MRRSARYLSLFALLLLGCSVLSGCFHYDEPICAYKCGAGTDCPSGYECRSDGYCHQEGSTEACGFSDAAVVLDMSVQVDEGTDLASFDSGSIDSDATDL